MRRFALSCTVFAALVSPVFAGGSVVINEVDADQTGTDSFEFLELAGTANLDLTDYYVVLYNGSNNLEYSTVALAGSTIPADGFFVVGVATVTNVDLTPSNWATTNAIQNGQDGIALWFDSTGLLTSSDFFGTDVAAPPAGAVLVDAVVYDTSDADDPELLAALTPGHIQVNENENSASVTDSIQRCPDFGAPFDTESYVVTPPTPGEANTCGTPSAWTDQAFALAGVNGDPLLVGTGDLSDGSSNSVDLSNAAASATAGLFLSLSGNPVPFKGGFLVPIPPLDPVILTTSGTGEISLPFVMPSGIPAGVEIWVQWAIQDAAAVKGVALSNAIMGLTP